MKKSMSSSMTMTANRIQLKHCHFVKQANCRPHTRINIWYCRLCFACCYIKLIIFCYRNGKRFILFNSYLYANLGIPYQLPCYQKNFLSYKKLSWWFRGCWTRFRHPFFPMRHNYQDLRRWDILSHSGVGHFVKFSDQRNWKEDSLVCVRSDTSNFSNMFMIKLNKKEITKFKTRIKITERRKKMKWACRMECWNEKFIVTFMTAISWLKRIWSSKLWTSKIQKWR